MLDENNSMLKAYKKYARAKILGRRLALCNDAVTRERILKLADKLGKEENNEEEI